MLLMDSYLMKRSKFGVYYVLMAFSWGFFFFCWRRSKCIYIGVVGSFILKKYQSTGFLAHWASFLLIYLSIKSLSLPRVIKLIWCKA
jgi:hypothetical protein